MRPAKGPLAGILSNSGFGQFMYDASIRPSCAARVESDTDTGYVGAARGFIPHAAQAFSRHPRFW